jgi:hypothetical protein
MAVRLSGLRAGSALHQEDYWYSFLLAAVRARARLEGLGKLEKKSNDVVEIRTEINSRILYISATELMVEYSMTHCIS